MKKALTILLLMAFLVHSSSQIWIIGVFKLNQAYISENICINRFDAIPLCKGSCFLEKKLEQDQKSQEKSSDLKTKNLQLYCESYFSAVTNKSYVSTQVKIHPPYFNQYIPSLFLKSVFRPPALV